MAGLSIAERQLEAKNFRLYLFQQISNQKSSYFSSLKSLDIKTPDDIKLFQNLLTNKKFCRGLRCYKDAIFSFNKSTITLSAIQTQIQLQQKLYVSCNLNFKYDIVYDLNMFAICVHERKMIWPFHLSYFAFFYSTVSHLVFTNVIFAFCFAYIKLMVWQTFNPL